VEGSGDGKRVEWLHSGGFSSSLADVTVLDEVSNVFEYLRPIVALDGPLICAVDPEMSREGVLMKAVEER